MALLNALRQFSPEQKVATACIRSDEVVHRAPVTSPRLMILEPTWIPDRMTICLQRHLLYAVWNDIPLQSPGPDKKHDRRASPAKTWSAYQSTELPISRKEGFCHASDKRKLFQYCASLPVGGDVTKTVAIKLLPSLTPDITGCNGHLQRKVRPQRMILPEGRNH